jgi:hypothetical protein
MPERPLADTLIDFLQTRYRLLILDNIEHLVAACADLAQPLEPRAAQFGG